MRGYGDICICIADSLCYKAETNTPLQSNYTLIKMLKKRKERKKKGSQLNCKLQPSFRDVKVLKTVSCDRQKYI